ncbi:hypothetical protein [Streptomyces sp. NRRL F-5065]|uniref:hypothetical protein n=1 Tax=Streptomyces sp. NRRL F-5065 TaxID=1463855 RepID=UPI001F370AF6|nr:hypothetical protein [Streptomyces sp. NRRL F-5065]
MAALMAAVEPARPVAVTGAGARPDGDDPAAKADSGGVVDRSSPGVTSDAFKAPEDLTGAGDAAGARHKEGVFKTLIRAGATRWAKGGGTANKRLDLEKARASSHQVKEARTTTVMKSPGLPTRNGSGGAAGGGRNSGGNSGGNSSRNSTGNGSPGTGRGGSGGAAGGGGRGSSGSNGGGGSGGGRGTSGNGGGSAKDTSAKGAKDSGSKGKDGSSGNAGAGGKAGKDGKAGTSGSGGGSTSGGSSGGNSGSTKDTADKGKGEKVDLKKGSGQGSAGSSGSGGGSGKSGASGSGGGSGSNGSSGKNGAPGRSGAAGHSSTGTDNRTPLQRSREAGHSDGSAVRDVVDHVKAYATGAKDGYRDKKEENGKEHSRLDKAHTDHKAKQQNPKKDTPKGTTATGPGGQTLVIAPPDEGDDGVSTDVKPLLVKEIDANTLTLGTDSARGSISRKELRNFKQYERKLEAKENHLIKVADACKQLEAAAEDEANDCQELADQAKAVEGGEKLAAKLTKLADSAKAQATEAAELHKRAKRAAEMCKVVLTNIGTRYAPLYKAVVDSDETKPAELRFYNDKGSYAPAA